MDSCEKKRRSRESVRRKIWSGRLKRAGASRSGKERGREGGTGTHVGNDDDLVSLEGRWPTVECRVALKIKDERSVSFDAQRKEEKREREEGKEEVRAHRSDFFL